MNKIILSVQSRAKDVFEEMDVTESLQLLAKNLTVENLKLLAEKSKKQNINKKIQRYKNLI
jgi:hypothetical protein